jgi:hypothetical protein
MNMPGRKDNQSSRPLARYASNSAQKLWSSWKRRCSNDQIARYSCRNSALSSFPIPVPDTRSGHLQLDYLYGGAQLSPKTSAAWKTTSRGRADGSRVMRSISNRMACLQD